MVKLRSWKTLKSRGKGYGKSWNFKSSKEYEPWKLICPVNQKSALSTKQYWLLKPPREIKLHECKFEKILRLRYRRWHQINYAKLQLRCSINNILQAVNSAVKVLDLIYLKHTRHPQAKGEAFFCTMFEMFLMLQRSSLMRRSSVQKLNVQTKELNINCMPQCLNIQKMVSKF